jgi:hypothetical protein
MDEGYDDVEESEDDLRNDDWFEKNYVGLMVSHPKEWIAVIDCEIIATGATKGELEENAEEIADGREYSIYFIPGTPL